jgi:hypothetical protein
MRFEIPRFSSKEEKFSEKSLSELIEVIERFENKKLNQNEKKEYLETLKNILAFLERKAEEKLQNNELSQFVDKEFRIKSDIYEKIYGQELLNIDKAQIKELESKLDEKLKNLSEEEKINEEISILKGKILELAKVIFANELFNEKFIVVRTNIYDDYFNGIDEIFIDKDTKNPIAAIDISSYDKLKKRPPNFRKRLKQNLIWGMILNGGYLKYGLYLKEEDKIEICGLANVPVLCLPLDFNEMLKVIKAYAENDKSSIETIGKKILENILEFFKNDLLNLDEKGEVINIKDSVIEKFLKNFPLWLDKIKEIQYRYKDVPPENLIRLKSKNLLLLELFEFYNHLQSFREITNFRFQRLISIYKIFKKAFESF